MLNVVLNGCSLYNMAPDSSFCAHAHKSVLEEGDYLQEFVLCSIYQYVARTVCSCVYDNIARCYHSS